MHIKNYLIVESSSLEQLQKTVDRELNISSYQPIGSITVYTDINTNKQMFIQAMIRY